MCVSRSLVIHATVLLTSFSLWTYRKYVLKCICLFKIFKIVLDGPVKIIMLSAMSQCYLPWHSHSPFVICYAGFSNKIPASKARISHMRCNASEFKCLKSIFKDISFYFYFFGAEAYYTHKPHSATRIARKKFQFLVRFFLHFLVQQDVLRQDPCV